MLIPVLLSGQTYKIIDVHDALCHPVTDNGSRSIFIFLPVFFLKGIRIFFEGRGLITFFLV